MTNIYDVLSKIHVKATGSIEKEVEEELKKEDPPKKEAKAVLESIPVEVKVNYKQRLAPEQVDESTKGNDKE